MVIRIAADLQQAFMSFVQYNRVHFFAILVNTRCNYHEYTQIPPKLDVDDIQSMLICDSKVCAKRQ